MIKGLASKIVLRGILITGLILLISSLASAEEIPEEYTLDSCLKQAVEYNLGIQSAILMSEKATFERQIALASFDPFFTANFMDSVARRGGISLQSQISGGSESKNMSGDFEIKKKLFTGAQWSLKFETSKNESRSVLAEGSQKVFEGNTTLTYTHPLLAGSGNSINRTALDIADLTQHQQYNQLENQKRELISQVKNTFYDILKARKAIEVDELSLKEAQTLVESTTAKYQAGALSSYEVTAAESGLAVREESLLLSQTDLQNKLDNLKTLMGLPLSQELRISGELEEKQIEVPTFDQILDKAQNMRPDLLIAKDSVELAQTQLKINSDMLKASLAFVGQLGLEGEDLKWGGALGDMSNLSWYTGLNYTVPLGGKREAHARVKQSELSLESSKLNYEELLRNIKLEITQGLRNIETAKQRLSVTTKGVKLQEDKLAKEKARHELGLITSGELLTFDGELASARLRHIEAMADYLKAISYLEYVSFSDWIK